MCSNHLFLLDSVLAETCSFLLDCSICWHITVHSILLWFFLFLWCWLLFLLFFIFYFIWVLCLFFLVSLARSLSVLFIFSKKKTALGFIDLFYCFYISFIYFLWSVLFPSFCWPWVIAVGWGRRRVWLRSDSRRQCFWSDGTVLYLDFGGIA